MTDKTEKTEKADKTEAESKTEDGVHTELRPAPGHEGAATGPRKRAKVLPDDLSDDNMDDLFNDMPV